MTDVCGVSLDEAWDELHQQDRFLPLYPTEWVVRFLGRHFRDHHQPRVLDLGCGGGRHSLLADDLGMDVVPYDLSTEGLRATRSRMQERTDSVTAVAGRYEALPFADASFDAVVVYGVLYYGNADRFQLGVDELHRVLRPGGWAQAVMRTCDDHRFGMGTEVESNTFVLDSDETNEGGMMMHFLDREGVDSGFAQWSTVSVERNDHTAGGGTITNSDWIIEAQR